MGFIFSLNGIAIANCCFAVIGNCPYLNDFVIIFLFGNLEQDPMTY